MEIFELKYFLGVATFENIHRASESLNVSASSLSKAIQRIEGELGINLFSRDGRNIRLNEHGRLLQRKASEIIRLEESVRLDLSGHQGSIHVVMAGPEVLLSEVGVSLSHDIKRRFPLTHFEYHSVSDEEAMREVSRGEVHLALITSDVPANLNLRAKVLSESGFHTYVGKGHPLYASAATKKTVPVSEVLKHDFASPNHRLLGQVEAKQSVDGWRDDQFPRKIRYRTSSLKLLEQFAIKGQAIVYLPDYYGDRLALRRLKISGCPYTCEQKISLIIRNSNEVGWLNQIF
jgi:DNA-binding transcriptional LysR family regulator